MSPIRILIVDDEDRFRQLMAKLFTAKGLDVVTAANGPEALCRLEDAGPFDVVILHQDAWPERTRHPPPPTRLRPGNPSHHPHRPWRYPGCKPLSPRRRCRIPPQTMLL